MSVRVRARRQSVPHLINLESLFYDFVAVVMIECRCRWKQMKRERGRGRVGVGIEQAVDRVTGKET